MGGYEGSCYEGSWECYEGLCYEGSWEGQMNSYEGSCYEGSWEGQMNSYEGSGSREDQMKCYEGSNNSGAFCSSKLLGSRENTCSAAAEKGCLEQKNNQYDQICN